MVSAPEEEEENSEQYPQVNDEEERPEVETIVEEGK
jgi:hypothetical protein